LAKRKLLIFVFLIPLLLGGTCSQVSAFTYNHKYYLQPVEALGTLGTFYLDDILPHGPAMLCPHDTGGSIGIGCQFVSRPLAESHTFSSFRVTFYFEGYHPGAAVQLWFVGVGPVGFSLVEPSAYSSTFTSNLGTGKQYRVEKGQRLSFLIQYSCGYPGLYQSGYGLPYEHRCTDGNHIHFVFGDSEHPSYLLTDGISLEGQPIPEFPMSTVVLAVSIMMACAIVRVRSSRGRRKPKKVSDLTSTLGTESGRCHACNLSGGQPKAIILGRYNNNGA